MAWQRIDDNAKAWELLCAGLLWFGHPPDMFHYDPDDKASKAWSRAEWMGVSFTGETIYKPNYILLED